MTITNHEVYLIFKDLISAWFNTDHVDSNMFGQYLLDNNLKGMNKTLSDIAEFTFNYYNLSKEQTECFVMHFPYGLQ